MKKNDKITVRAWVQKNGEYVNIDTLTPEERAEAATQLKLMRLNAMFAGQAKFERA